MDLQLLDIAHQVPDMTEAVRGAMDRFPYLLSGLNKIAGTILQSGVINDEPLPDIAFHPSTVVVAVLFTLFVSYRVSRLFSDDQDQVEEDFENNGKKTIPGFLRGKDDTPDDTKMLP